MIDFLNKILNKSLGWTDSNPIYRSVGGGCINDTAHIKTNRGEYFVKWNHGMLDMFEKEKKGLELLAEGASLNTPKTLGVGEIDGKGYLLMEYIEGGRMNTEFWEKLGTGLAALHRNTNERFGLDHDNYIGRLPQSNTRAKSWIDFFIAQRMQPQIKLAFDGQRIESTQVARFDLLFSKLSSLIPEERPALLHGDLWSGNIHCDRSSEPYLIDPAVFYGHREAELAFTSLFGGFDSQFYQSYQESFPLHRGFESRVDLFNMYPLMVHVNLFGTSYLSGVDAVLRRYA